MKIEVSQNNNPASLTSNSGTPSSVTIIAENQEGLIRGEMSAAQIDELIADLVTCRAEMQPVHPAEIDPLKTSQFQCDNLLWDTFPDKGLRGVVLAFQNPGFGWITVTFSRAQIEDLVADIEFSLHELSNRHRKQNSENHDGGEIVHLRNPDQ